MRVRDSGVGIPAEMLPRIFEMFTQVDRTLERSHGGLGIGLTLVKQLVEMHGGGIEAHSGRPGRGSEFVVRLPGGAGVAPSESPPPDGGGRAPGPALRRILIVDDNRVAATMLDQILRQVGHEVRTVHDGEAAVREAGEFRPDVVLLDIGLPGRNGYEVARHIRQQPWGHEVVLIALTGWGQDEYRRRSEEAGIDHHLVKPVDPEGLIEWLAGVQPVWTS